MAKNKLITCTTCGEQYARTAKHCVKCGAKNKKARSGCMTVFGGVLLMFGLMRACVDGNNGADLAENSKPFYMDQPALVESAEWTISSAREGEAFGYMTIFDQSEFVETSSSATKLIMVAGMVVNRGDKQVTSFSKAVLVDADGVNYGAHNANNMSKRNLEIEALNPNIPQNFVLYFEVPASASGLKFAAPSFNNFSKRVAMIDLGLDKADT